MINLTYLYIYSLLLLLMTSSPIGQKSPLSLYISTIPYTPSLYEAKNQFNTFIHIGFWAILYHFYAEDIWKDLMNKYNLEELGFAFTFFILSFVFVFWGLFFYVLDCYPEKFNKFRIQSFRPIKKGDYAKATKTAIINSWFISSLFGYLSYKIYKIRTKDINFNQIPSMAEILLHNAAFLLIQQVGFYYSHRLLHIPFFYKHIHKKHHQFIAPIGISAIYAHPIEHIVSNLLPLFLGPMIMKSHILTYWIWLILAITGTMINHSNYCLPGFSIPINHDFHHYVQQQNFGVLGILDLIHNTDIQYRKMLIALRQKREKENQNS